jgi:hypothetical protein
MFCVTENSSAAVSAVYLSATTDGSTGLVEVRSAGTLALSSVSFEDAVLDRGCIVFGGDVCTLLLTDTNFTSITRTSGAGGCIAVSRNAAEAVVNVTS